MGVAQGLGGDLERWLTPFLEVAGRKTHRAWAPLCVQGLLGPEGRGRRFVAMSRNMARVAWSPKPNLVGFYSSRFKLTYYPTGHQLMEWPALFSAGLRWQGNLG
jgi:hypothetical protein